MAMLMAASTPRPTPSTRCRAAASSARIYEILDTDQFGPIPRVNVSLKLSALNSQFKSIDPIGSVAHSTYSTAGSSGAGRGPSSSRICSRMVVSSL